MSPDLINGIFELCGSIILLLNLGRLWKQRSLKGTHWAPVAFFISWGCWNLFYYPHLDQWLSFIGGCAIVGVNTAWIGLLVWLAATGRLK